MNPPSPAEHSTAEILHTFSVITTETVKTTENCLVSFKKEYNKTYINSVSVNILS